MTDPTRTADPLAVGVTASVADPAATTSPPSGPSATSTATPAADRYVLGEEIARGGMGEVYRATDTVLNREVAVKVLQPKYGPTSAAARRFADEARITGQLQHPAIPPVHDLGTLPDGRPFLAMKLIKGDTLDEQLKARTDVSADRGKFVAVFEAICQAVAYAHAHGVIHRDLKPANVMVGAFTEVQVMDWGLAKVLTNRDREGASSDPESTSAETEIKSPRDGSDQFTQAGSVLGTPAFMPPEQAVGAVGKIDQRSDVFGLGAVLAVILTGTPPFAASSAETTRVMAARGDVTECFSKLDVCGADPELVALCKRCLSPKLADRPANAGAVAVAVHELRTAADERARQAELGRVKAEGEKAAAEIQAQEQRKRRWVQAALGLSFTAMAVLGGAFAWWADVQSRTRAEQAEREINKAIETAEVRYAQALGANRDLALWAEARAAALQARERAADAPVAIRERVDQLLAEIEQVEKNRRLITTLMDIHASMGDILDTDGWQDFKGANARYTQAFRDYGLDLFTTPPQSAAHLLTSLGGDVRVPLAAAIDDWGYVRFVQNRYDAEKAETPRLFEVTRLLDPDPMRNRIRDCILARNPAAIARLAEELDPACHPVQTVNLVAVYPYFFGFDAGQSSGITLSRQVLQKAYPHHPSDFQINHNLAHFLNLQTRYVDAVAHASAAIAIRPKSAASWQEYALALTGLQRYPEALAAIRQLLALNPQNVYAHGLHGDLLLRTGDTSGAVTAYQEVVKLQPRSTSALTKLAVGLTKQKDWPGAVAAWRRTLDVNPNDTIARNGLGTLLERTRPANHVGARDGIRPWFFQGSVSA